MARKLHRRVPGAFRAPGAAKEGANETVPGACLFASNRSADRDSDLRAGVAVRSWPGSQRDVAVLLPGVLEALGAQPAQRVADAQPGVARHDDIVDEPARGGHERVGKARPVLLG